MSIPIVPLEKRKYIMIHHSASPRDKTTVDMIRHWHVDVNGWADIGYTWMIDGNGARHMGRHPKYQGAHCPKYNISAYGVCVFGNFETEVPKQVQLDELVRLVKDIYEYYKSGLVILGHRDGKPTACPGKYLYAQLPYIKEAVK